MNVEKLIDSTIGKNASLLEEALESALETFLENVEEECGNEVMTKLYAVQMATTILNTTNLKFFHTKMNELKNPMESA